MFIVKEQKYVQCNIHKQIGICKESNFAWQLHIFGEGNTRTTAVFFIKYLRKLGFDVTNDIFAKNAGYFRNALVRANYSDLKNGIYETTEYLELFLRNLLLGEKNELHNRGMHISGLLSAKVDIESVKVDIQNKMLSFSNTISKKPLGMYAKYSLSAEGILTSEGLW